MTKRMLVAVLAAAVMGVLAGRGMAADGPRERVSIDDDWRFFHGDPENSPVNLALAPGRGNGGRGPAGARAGGGGGRGRGRGPGSANAETLIQQNPLWAFLLADSANFLSDPSKVIARPEGNPVAGLAWIGDGFDDSQWRKLDLPHDFGIEGPFSPPGTPGFLGNGGTGRLPFYGQAWYRKKLDIPVGDAGKQIILNVDGAMAYAMVFLNGQLVGGWPYGYASWDLDLTPYVKPGGTNELVFRLDNPPNSSRWYPGGGIYRNLWLTKTSPVHVGQWGTYLTTPEVSAMSAGVKLAVTVENNAKDATDVSVATEIFALDAQGEKGGAVGRADQVRRCMWKRGKRGRCKVKRRSWSHGCGCPFRGRRTDMWR